MLVGFTAVIAQIVLMRELMVVFCGNEMSLGPHACELAPLDGDRQQRAGPRGLADTAASPAHGSLEVLVALAFPLAIFMARASKGAFQSVPGEILGRGR